MMGLAWYPGHIHLCSTISNWPAVLSAVKQRLDSLINKSFLKHYYPTLWENKGGRKTKRLYICTSCFGLCCHFDIFMHDICVYFVFLFYRLKIHFDVKWLSLTWHWFNLLVVEGLFGLFVSLWLILKIDKARPENKMDVNYAVQI